MKKIYYITAVFATLFLVGCGEPQADRRRHQRGNVDLMLFNQRETERGARVGGEDHPPAGEEDAEPSHGNYGCDTAQ